MIPTETDKYFSWNSEICKTINIGYERIIQTVQNAQEHTVQLSHLIISITTPDLSCVNSTCFQFVSVYNMAVVVYKCLHGMALPYLAVDCVPVTSMASRRHLRSAVFSFLTVTGTNTRFGTQNCAVAGAKIWNILPADQ